MRDVDEGTGIGESGDVYNGSGDEEAGKNGISKEK